MNTKVLEIVGYAASGIGLVAGLVKSVVEKKQLDVEIEKKVAEAIEKALTK